MRRSDHLTLFRYTEIKQLAMMRVDDYGFCSFQTNILTGFFQLKAKGLLTKIVVEFTMLACSHYRKVSKAEILNSKLPTRACLMLAQAGFPSSLSLLTGSGMAFVRLYSPLNKSKDTMRDNDCEYKY
ncbi:hypothetical protein Tco_0242338 [Tanacetum coccineum]